MKQRRHNPLINSATGGRFLSASQLFFFLLHPPKGFGVITTTGRVSGKRRRRCIRAIRDGERVLVVAMHGAAITGWAKNALASPEVKLRIRGGTFSGRIREVEGETERAAAERAYCETVNPFDFLECMMWVKGRPSRQKIVALHRGWFASGTPLVAELSA